MAAGPKAGLSPGYEIRERNYQDEAELDEFDERQRVAALGVK